MSQVLVLIAPTAVLAQQDNRVVAVGTGRDIHAQIEIQRAAYSLGDTACVRISLVNTSDRPVGYMAATGASDMVHLVIKRAGQPLKPNVEPAGSASRTMASFPPRAVGPLASGQWVPITDWGYQIQEAGDYTIEGVPQIWGPLAAPDTVTVRSNQVAFSIQHSSKAHASCKVVRPIQAQRPNADAIEAHADSLFKVQRARVGATVEAKMAD